MNSTMRVARLHAINQPMKIEELPVPEPRPTDVLVEVKACNIVPNLPNVLASYSEWFPQLPLPKLPATFGLDSTGVVAAVGSHVTDVAVGDRVYVNPGLSCGSCRACRRNQDQNCDSYTFMGYFSFGVNGQRLFDAYPYGGLGEYLTAPQRNLVKLPDTVSFEGGARFGYLGTGYSALRRAGVGPGSTVFINGISGTLGLGTCLSALAMGATRVFGTGRNTELLGEVRRIAPSRIHVVPATSADLRGWTREHNNGEGVDVVIDALGPEAPADAYLNALETLRRGGIAVNIGGMMEPLQLDMISVMTNQLTILGSAWFSTAEAQDMADLVGTGQLDLSILEHHTFPLEKINEALNDLPARHGGFTNFICVP
ncbi:alcohol dehydrogenase catalytic domain-containing protein [Rhodococcus sp. ZPP]|uniref:alcohol dehydrogenase catalytic domain-containing protein n=1 Tax=Rhodococcus sp. ZPP TaxID=2749906 RepID=UPI001AD87F0A|nr:alcohol dehydrogenase catalytic domain-containing protein [Rhodococcus sp. ZPP]QTJ68330.1 alcohol dehydrogenase catalytic domain-containing protein [Rhodococcus sp. ZPP]